MRGYLRFCPLLALLVLPAGCGKNYTLVPVSGHVKMDGLPLAHAEVRFTPTSGKDLPDSVATTDENGHYTLHLGSDGNTAGAVVGEHRVTISIDPRKNKAIMKEEGPGAMMKGRGGQPSETLPAKYNRDTTLTCTVPEGGRDDANFDLTSEQHPGTLRKQMPHL